ncbi:MAG: HEAT repeat domain-containing protein [Prochlorococcus sp.]
MPNFVAGAAAFVLVMVLWGLGRRPGKSLLSSTDASNVAALNRVQLSLVESAFTPPEQLSAGVPTAEPDWQAPATVQERLSLQSKLSAAMAAGPDQRLEAVQRAAHWRHVSVLPVLRQGLRDSDSRVVVAAAEAMERYRGAPRRQAAQPGRPPRNVARMR